MAACVETMFYVEREKPWHGLGTPVKEALTSEEALEKAGLNWDVVPTPVFDHLGRQIVGYTANERSSDESILGIVGDRYQIVQNREAFDFTDSLLGEGMRYETAGSLRNGRRIWLLGKMPERYVNGDKFEPYICFTNTHDGTGAVKCCMTPVRVVCNNTLNLALTTAKRSWSARHTGNIQNKLGEARRTLELADVYLTNFIEQADRLANEKMDEAMTITVLNGLLPLKPDATDRMKRTKQETVDGVMACVFAPDLQKFLWTKWGFLNAVADYVDHSEPNRKTKNWQENKFLSIVDGGNLLDKAYAAVAV